jgi:hypothetical protein
MLSRGGLSIVSVVALIIVIGLLLTHSKATGDIGNVVFSGLDTIIRDLELNPKPTSTAH